MVLLWLHDTSLSPTLQPVINTVDHSTFSKSLLKNLLVSFCLLSSLLTLSPTLLGVAEGQTFSTCFRVICIHKTNQCIPAKKAFICSCCVAIEISHCSVSIKSQGVDMKSPLSGRPREKGKLIISQTAENVRE